METYEHKRTKWEGLWWHPEYARYSSAVFNLAQIKKFKGGARLVMMKNKYFNNGENKRPNYVFSIMDANCESTKELEVEEDGNDSTLPMMEWIPCTYINNCFIPELKDVPYSKYLVTYMTGKMERIMCDVVWIERGRVLNKNYQLLTAYMEMPKPYKGGNAKC